jgi:hypothetical protein
MATAWAFILLGAVVPAGILGGVVLLDRRPASQAPAPGPRPDLGRGTGGPSA